jgi:hypothetical protein
VEKKERQDEHPAGTKGTKIAPVARALVDNTLQLLGAKVSRAVVLAK